MAVRIRLARVGRSKSPAYRVVVADQRKARDGRFIEIIGHYQPLRAETKIEVNGERALKWLKQGAIPSETVRSILRKSGILKQFHEMRKPAPKPTSFIFARCASRPICCRNMPFLRCPVDSVMATTWVPAPCSVMNWSRN